MVEKRLLPDQVLFTRALAVALPIALLAAPYVAIVAQQTGHFAALNKTSGTWTTGQNIMPSPPSVTRA